MRLPTPPAGRRRSLQGIYMHKTLFAIALSLSTWAAVAQDAPASTDDIAAHDPRVGKPMFVAAQDVSSLHHCERLLRVRSIEGDDAHFYAACPSGGAPIEIHCNGTNCHEAAPQG